MIPNKPSLIPIGSRTSLSSAGCPLGRYSAQSLFSLYTSSEDMRPNLRQKSANDVEIAQQPHHLHTCQVVRSKATDQARAAVARAQKTAQDWLQAKPKTWPIAFFSLAYSNAKIKTESGGKGAQFGCCGLAFLRFFTDPAKKIYQIR